jgi:asparagine synthase (glutamine-hydrolysing)
MYEFSDKQLQMASLYGWLPISKVKRLFQKELALFQPTDFLKKSLTNIPKESSALNQMLYWEMKYFLTDHNLNYTDKMSMMHGVEVRVPFLDKELVEFSTTIPPELKMKGTTTKYLLKKVAEKYLPNEVIYRPKSGFGAPVRDWITKDLNSKIESELSKKEIEKIGIFNPIEVEEIISANKKGKIDASYSIWCLLAIHSWYKQFVKNS